MLNLSSAFFLTCTADNNLFQEFTIEYNEIKTITPYELEPGQVYTAQNITYLGDDTFNVLLYIELLEYGENIRPLVTGSNVDFICTLGPNFSLKEKPVTPIGTFIENSDVITWSIPENLISPTAQLSFTLKLNPNWALNTPYYTNEYISIRFTPTADNPFYYTTKTVTDSTFVVQNFSWNNGNNGFNSIRLVDSDLGLTFSLSPGSNVRIGETTYLWSTESMPSDATRINTVGVYKIVEYEKSTYHFWIKTDNNSVFGAESCIIVYSVDVFSGGGNSDIIPGHKTVYYTVAKKNPSFNWIVDTQGSHVILELLDTSYILKKSLHYNINYILNDGINPSSNPAIYSTERLPLTIINPSRENYIFLGWDIQFVDGTKRPLEFFAGMWQIPAGTVGDVTLIANWEEHVLDNVYRIQYVLNDGLIFVNNPAHYTSEELPLFIEDPSRDGYLFLGWDITYHDKTTLVVSSLYSIPPGTTGDLSLTAIWEPSYNINYILNDGVNALGNPTAYSPHILPLKIYSPSCKNYDFLYWTVTYDNGTKTTSQINVEPYELPVGTTGEITLTANWNIPYNIRYELFGGNITDAPLTYTIDMLPLKINNPTRMNYLFMGWIIYQNDTITSTNNTTPYEIQKTTIGDLSLAAQWVPIANDKTPTTNTTPLGKENPPKSSPPTTLQPEDNSNNPIEPTTPPPSNEHAPLNYIFLLWTIIFAAGLIASTFTFKLKKDADNNYYSRMS